MTVPLKHDLRPYQHQPWLVEPSHLRRLALKIASISPCPTARDVAKAHRKAMQEARETQTAETLPEVMAATKPIRAVPGKVGVIPVRGPIEQKMTGELMKAGGTSTEQIAVALDTMLNDPAVSAIVFRIDSPGGSSYGVQELSDKIYNARGQKPLYAHADSLAASAAFWIATSAEQFYITPGGDTGSLGVYALHIDESKALEAEGLTVTMVKAGKYKAEFASISPLSEESAAYLQEQVNATYDKFLNAVKRNRGTTLDNVRRNYGQGRVFNAGQALEAGMVDRIITFEDLMRKLTGVGDGPAPKGQARADAEGPNIAAETSAPASPVGVSADILRLRHAHRKRKETV